VRVLVCGGRKYSDRQLLFDTLDKIHKVTPIDLIIHGNCSGADKLAGLWASMHMHVTAVPVPAQWDKYGKSAGPRRNASMLDRYKPDLVVAAPGGAGTEDMVNRAIMVGVRVMRIKERMEHEGESDESGEVEADDADGS
jgi:hypothetical protein